MTTSFQDVLIAFQKIWNYPHFRPPQGEIIQTILAGKDALVIMPTGGGKSLCFQLPALLKTGVTLVISPLIALMENQVQELQEKRILAATIHHQIPRYKSQKILQDLAHNRLRLLYLSPETLLSPPLWQILTQPDVLINGLIVDEAHCLVQWGETFRPSYRRLGSVRSALLKSQPVGHPLPLVAFTATADPSSQQLISQVLELNNPQEFLVSPYRSNLSLKTQYVCTPKARKEQLLKFIKTAPDHVGLVYVRTHKDSEKVANWLIEKGYKTAAYHGGLSPEERREVERKWLQEEILFVVCTSAFGMGINKSNVRWVLQFQTPFILSDYLQEIGRAGRDGKPAEALTLISEWTGWLDPTDQKRWRYFIEQNQSQLKQAQQLIKKLPPQGKISSWIRQDPNYEIALSLLHSNHQLNWSDPFHYEITSWGGNSSTSYHLNQKAVEQMRKYLYTHQCRWHFLLEAFGFTSDFPGGSCGHCDRCCPQN